MTAICKSLRTALGGACLAWALVAAGQSRTIESIAAVVDDNVVLASEVLERYEAVMEGLRAEGRTEAPPRDAILAQILERLIIESIQLQEAERRGIVIDDETLTAAVSQYAAQKQHGDRRLHRDPGRRGHFLPRLSRSGAPPADH